VGGGRRQDLARGRAQRSLRFAVACGSTLILSAHCGLRSSPWITRRRSRNSPPSERERVDVAAGRSHVASSGAGRAAPDDGVREEQAAGSPWRRRLRERAMAHSSWCAADRCAATAGRGGCREPRRAVAASHRTPPQPNIDRAATPPGCSARTEGSSACDRVLEALPQGVATAPGA
jgi:hypothetical protein